MICIFFFLSVSSLFKFFSWSAFSSFGLNCHYFCHNLSGLSLLPLSILYLLLLSIPSLFILHPSVSFYFGLNCHYFSLSIFVRRLLSSSFCLICLLFLMCFLYSLLFVRSSSFLFIPSLGFFSDPSVLYYV